MGNQHIIRTGVIGLGGRGRFFARLFGAASHPGFQLHSLCDRDPQVLDKLRSHYGDSVSYHTDMHTMLEDPELDAVLVTTNDPHHVEPALAALAAGKHVLVEKPLCQRAEDAVRIVEAARSAPGIFMVGFELRYCNLFQQMKQLLDEGRIGEVKIGHCFDNVSVGGNYFFHDPRKQKEFYRTLLLQKATHSLDLLNWFMGSHPVKVYGIGGQDYFGGEADDALQCHACPAAPDCPYQVDPHHFVMDYGAAIEVADNCVWSKQIDLDDNAELCISYANGGKATFHECHFTPDYSREFWLVGTKGKMYGYYDNPGRFLIRIEYSHASDRRTEEFKPPHYGGSHGGGDEAMRDEFYRRIVEGDRASAAADSAYYATALAACADESIRSGMPIAIPTLSA